MQAKKKERKVFGDCNVSNCVRPGICIGIIESCSCHQWFIFPDDKNNNVAYKIEEIRPIIILPRTGETDVKYYISTPLAKSGLKPLDTIVPWCSMGFREVLNWVLMTPRGASPSDGCTPVRCSFFSNLTSKTEFFSSGHPIRKKLTPFGMMGEQLRSPLEPLGVILPYCDSRGVSGWA